MATKIERQTSFPGAIDPGRARRRGPRSRSRRGETVAVRARGYWESVWFRLRKDKLALAGAGFIVFLFLVAFAGAPVAAHFLGHGPNDQFFRRRRRREPATGKALDARHPVTATGHKKQLLILGADSTLGRDEFLRVLYGAQVSLEVGVGATVLSMALGLLLGSMAGFFRGWLDTLISRLTEITMAFPYLLFVIALAATVGTRLDNVTFGFLGQGVVTLVIVFGLFSWFYPARVFRGITLSLREKEFIEAARMVGASDWRIIRSHILPHLVGPTIVLLDAERRTVHPRRGRALVPRPRDQAADRELGEPARRFDPVPDHAAAADGLARARADLHDARLQPARRRAARRVRPARRRPGARAAAIFRSRN